MIAKVDGKAPGLPQQHGNALEEKKHMHRLIRPFARTAFKSELLQRVSPDSSSEAERIRKGFITQGCWYPDGT